MTDRTLKDKLLADISTHTLTWSVTAPPIVIPDGIPNFNSHAHVERDAERYRPENIHTYFNSHAHVERDKTPGGGSFFRL